MPPRRKTLRLKSEIDLGNAAPRMQSAEKDKERLGMDYIDYTLTDEAPMLATASLLPIVKSFLKTADIEVRPRDISLAGRILAAFSDHLPPAARRPDALAALQKLTSSPQANIIKLPNISASLPQLLAAVKELQNCGYELPDYPENPQNSAEKEIRRRYDAVKGSAVNPVLREGNSDRRAPQAVKNFARQHPHRMGEWKNSSRTRVATMASGDFRANEKSVTLTSPHSLDIVFIAADGKEELLRGGIETGVGDIFDASAMQAAALDDFLHAQIAAAKEENLLFSLHLKATMMKVSDPLIFGHAVKAFFPRTFAAYGQTLTNAGLDAEKGLGAIFAGLAELANGEEIKQSFAAEVAAGPELAMVDSAAGITNLHVPSDVIIDASMPAMIRNSGQMWNSRGESADTLAVIPDSSYAGVYQTVIDDCKAQGAFDPAKLGSVPNVGLMAQKAEEYGSHDKTFLIKENGRVVVRAGNSTLLEIPVAAGDIYRSCLTKAAPIQNWVQLALKRARLSATPAIFWLDPQRAHDRELRQQVEKILAESDLSNLDIQILDPVAATKATLERIRRGKDTISVTGNVLRDYLTDLFPIMELGTSAKMLSIVPLMAGGGLFETGAGGSAPKHVQQLLEVNYLRWDSLGEFLALAESLRGVEEFSGNKRAGLLAAALDTAIAELLNTGKSPARRLGDIDNRGSHAWLAIYWAAALSAQKEDTELAQIFTPLARALAENAAQISDEMLAIQGKPADIGGYYFPDPEKVQTVMRPSTTLNKLLDSYL